MQSSGKINVLFVLPNFDTGGSEKLVFDIIAHIDKERFSPVLCVFFSGKYEESFLKIGVPFYVIHKDRILTKFKTAKFISGIVRKHGIRIVNTHHNSPLIQGVLPFKILNRVRWFHTEHTRLDLDPNVSAKIFWLSKFALKFVDYVIGISQGVCDYFFCELGLPSRRVVKILNGVDVERFRAAISRTDRTEIRKDLGLKEDEIVVGMFANFRKQKNHQVLLRALATIASRVANVRLVLAGSGPEENFIRALAGGLGLEGRVLFLGPRHDIPELMNMIDIYCLPSHFEGLPFSLIEAFAAGKKVVATDVIGNRDVVSEIGDGVLVVPDNPQKLAEALSRAIEQVSDGHYLPLTKEDLSDARTFPFSFDKMIKKYEEIFAEYGTS